MHNRLFRRVAAGALLVSAACASGAQRTEPAGAAPSPGAATAPGANYLYVTNQGEATVALIDVDRRELVTTLDLQELGFSANAKPHHVVVEPDGSHWYVSLVGDNVVVKLDRQNRVVGRAPFEVAGLMALDPARDRLVVGRSMSAVNPPKRIGVVDRDDMSIEEIDVFFPRPHGIVVQPSSGTVYSASMGVNQVAAIDVEDEEVELVDVAGPQHAFMQFALSPDQRTLVASTELTGKLMVFDVSEPASPRLVREVEIGPMAFDPIFTPDGRYVYVPSKGGNFVAKVDARSWEVVGRIEGDAFAEPHGVAFSPDGRWLFVSNNNLRAAHDMGGGEHARHEAGPVKNEGRGWVTVIDTRTDTVEKTIALGKNPTGMGVAAPNR